MCKIGLQSCATPRHFESKVSEKLQAGPFARKGEGRPYYPTTGKTEEVRKMGSKISLGAPIGQAINHHDVINKYYTIKLIKSIVWNKNAK